MTQLVAGVDAGGTSTRCALVDGDGRLVGTGDSAGGNPNSSADAAAALHAALAAALGDLRTVDVLVLGAAGAGPAGAPRAEATAREVAAHLGVAVGRFVVHSDVEVAYAAGSAEPGGAVLIAGTGAVAARIRDFRVSHRVDGHGYLLGDAGSAVWIGAAGLRAALAAVEGTGPATALRAAVAGHVGALDVRADGAAGEADAAQLDETQAVLAAVYARPPAWLGSVAPLVDAAAARGDAVARRIVDDAVAALVASARAAFDPAGALVVAGGVAAGEGFVGTRVRAALADALGRTPTPARDTRVGAVAIGLRALVPGRPGVAARLVTAGLR